MNNSITLGTEPIILSYLPRYSPYSEGKCLRFSVMELMSWLRNHQDNEQPGSTKFKEGHPQERL